MYHAYTPVPAPRPRAPDSCSLRFVSRSYNELADRGFGYPGLSNLVRCSAGRCAVCQHHLCCIAFPCGVDTAVAYCRCHDLLEEAAIRGETYRRTDAAARDHCQCNRHDPTAARTCNSSGLSTFLDEHHDGDSRVWHALRDRTRHRIATSDQPQPPLFKIHGGHDSRAACCRTHDGGINGI